MTEDDNDEKNDNTEKLCFMEFLRITEQHETKEIFSNNAQNSSDLSKKRVHVGILSSSKSLPLIKLKRNESKSMNDEIDDSTPCTFYEAISNSNQSTDKSREPIVSELAGPSTISTLPRILRASRRWDKKACYSLDSPPKQILDDIKTTFHSDLLQMPTICSSLIESNKHSKKANNYENNAENNLKLKR